MLWIYLRQATIVDVLKIRDAAKIKGVAEKENVQPKCLHHVLEKCLHRGDVLETISA